jgi:hypothetical protein
MAANRNVAFTAVRARRLSHSKVSGGPILILAGVVVDEHRCHRSVANQCQCNVSHRG